MAIKRIYTDGSCPFGNPGPGGYALIIVKDNEVLDIGQSYSPHTTNNQMELLAIKDAIIYCIDKDISECKIYSDSQYSVFGINQWMYKWMRNGWRGSKHTIIANVKIWQEVYCLWEHAKQKLNISIHYIKGHADNKFNNLADKKAREIICSYDTNQKK
jgi:ribonuclease HI